MKNIVINIYRAENFSYQEFFYIWRKIVKLWRAVFQLILSLEYGSTNQNLANFMLYNFVMHNGTQNMLHSQDIHKKHKKYRNFYSFWHPPKLAQGPRGWKLRIYIPEYPQIRCENFKKFGILSRWKVISTGLYIVISCSCVCLASSPNLYSKETLK